jgi:signal transduction histidine kinase
VHIATESTSRVTLFVFPYLLEKLIRTRYTSSAHLSDIARLVKLDPATCFMAMRLDRAAGSRQPAGAINTIEEIIGRIGMAGVDAITSQAMTDQALNPIHRRQALALGWLWRHSLLTALLSQKLAHAINFGPEEEAYIAGLLHNIGKLAIFALTPPDCAPMLADPTQAVQLLEAETQVVECGYDQFGAQLIRRYTNAWLVSDAVRHHATTTAEVKNALPLVQIIWAANRLAGESAQSSATFQAVSGLLHVAPQQLARMTAAANRQAQALADELGVVADVQQDASGRHDYPIPLADDIRISTALSKVYAALLEASGRNAVMRVLQRSLSTFLGIDTLIVVEPAPQAEQLVGIFSTGDIAVQPIDRLQIPLTATACLPVICHTSGHPVDSFSPSRQARLTLVDHQLMAYMNTDGLACLPLRSDAGLSSPGPCLILGIDENVWPWIAGQATLLQAMVDAVAGALEREGRKGDRQSVIAADQLASMVHRTRKIVHEINNPLSIIKNYLKALMLRPDEKQSGRDELRIIDEEINRVADLIKSLTAAPEKGIKALQRIDLNATVADILDLFEKRMPSQMPIDLQQDLGAHIPIVTVDRNRLKQVLINLLKNAMEAMTEGGTISVSTRMLKASLGRTGSMDDVDRIRISICDDGPGIDDSIRNDLFKPHVSSKSGHDGLGLSIVQEAVDHLNGILLCESDPGKGTCFHIELPISINGQ